MSCRPKHTALTAAASSTTLLIICIFIGVSNNVRTISAFLSSPTLQPTTSLKTHPSQILQRPLPAIAREGLLSSSSLLDPNIPITRRVGWPSSSITSLQPLSPPRRRSAVATFAEPDEVDLPSTTTTTTTTAAAATTTTSSIGKRKSIILATKSFLHRIKKPFFALTTTTFLYTTIKTCILQKTLLTSIKSKFLLDWKTYSLIPFVAAFVGWFTNYLAVKMIFYPIQYRGLNIKRWKENPLGLIGWQGIVPTKTKKMSEAMVKMVTEQLLSVEEVFGRLEPEEIAKLLAPEMPKLAYTVALQHFPEIAPRLSPKSLSSYPRFIYDRITQFCSDFVVSFTQDMQKSISSILNVRNCVVEQMLADRSLLGKLFQKCGEKELDFLTDSGLWFGFLLGTIQMLIALVSDNPWTISIGGLIVGFATNWLALEWIFKPVDPKKVGPFTLQGLFLRRQKEASADFSKFFANNVLTSKNMWNTILTDETTLPAFRDLFTRQLYKFLKLDLFGKTYTLDKTKYQKSSKTASANIGDYVHVVHDYVDERLELEDTFRTKMEAMTSRQFERVLHPIFEEDELTLILSGAALGFLAGFIQQLFSTGKLTLPALAAFRFWTKIPFFS